jgi:uncharacterized membrane protein YphA (DoxX/SURF4 family)
MSPTYLRYAPVVGRLLMCIIFLLSGFNKVMHWSDTEQYMISHGMTVATGLLLAGAVVVEVGAGLALLLGFQVRLIALLLVLYLIPTTLIFHNFWSHPDQMINFLKNLAIMGGLIELSVAGAGAFSVDAAMGRRSGFGWTVWRAMRRMT